MWNALRAVWLFLTELWEWSLWTDNNSSIILITEFTQTTTPSATRKSTNYGPVHTMLEEFGNAASFLRWGLPSTLIRHENGAFRKRSSNRRNLKTSALRFSVNGKPFENEACWKRWRYNNLDIPLPERNSPKWPVIVPFSNLSGVVWTENIWFVFRVKPPFSNSSSVV